MKSRMLAWGLQAASFVLLFAALGGSPEASAQAQGQPAATEANNDEIETVIVSARKREESIAEVPTAITAFTAESLKDYGIQSFADYATKTPNLSFSYGGGPTGFADARTVAIRGITGQNLFGTGGATGFYIDDTPLPSSIDPRVVDLASIEILKGPQGTLYGESSLGGNVRLITRKPDLTSSGVGYMAEAGATSGGGAPDGGANIIGNIVMSPGNLALRIVAFGNYDAGYLTRTYVTDPANPATGDPFLAAPRTSVNNQAATETWGGSATLLWRASDRLDVTARVLYQDLEYNGFPATFAPLPEFTTQQQYVLNRAFDVQAKAWDTFTLPTLDFKWSGDGYTIVWANSYFYRHTRDLEDSTYGTEQVLTGGFYGVTGVNSQPYLWDGEHYQDEVASELRWSWNPWHNLSGTLGAYFANTRTKFQIPPTYSTGISGPGTSSCSLAVADPCVVTSPAWYNDEIWTQTNPGQQKDWSIFGEVYYKFANIWTLTLGARQYWLSQNTDYTADGFLNGGPTPSAPENNSQSGLNPKFALQVQASDSTMIYGSASKGFRAGGAQPFLTFCSEPGLPIQDITHLASDTLWTYELGAKWQESRWLVTGDIYYIDWSNLQQQVGLPCGYYLQVNGNKATVKGAELEANGRLAPGLQVRIGAGYENTSITDPGPLASVGVLPDSRISGVPAFTGFIGGVYTHPMGSEMQGFCSVDYSYTGNSTSLLVGGFGTVATRPGFSLLNLRLGVDRGQSELSLSFKNILNSKPNLGDIGYVGYAQYNQAGSVIPQGATLQTFTVMLQYQKNL
ncbi:MAG TPA: TonB-dependent receptor [Steroidobacteraceae bacterium]|nr:TonB-dependent receptor [Steroidobacteraceae bacterium]